jgi:hypothetical protein
MGLGLFKKDLGMSTTNQRSLRLPKQAAIIFGVLALLGGVAMLGEFLSDPRRAWSYLLIVGNYLIGLGLGGLVLVGLHYLTGARWSLPIRRIEEAMTAALPAGAIGLILVLMCQPSLYIWMSAESPRTSESPLHHFWLNRPFFLIRSLIYIVVWLFLAAAIVRNSRLQDKDPNPSPTQRNIRLSAIFLVVFGITCWLASTDWIMSLEPEWTSTMFGVYHFAGLFLSAIAALVILVIWLRRLSPLQSVINDSHLHDLGTLLFAFSSFWMYTWFCQYMLIWYVDNPEETAYFLARRNGYWPVFVKFDIALNWAIPFLVLLFRSAKRSSLILGTIACGVLIGRWVDLSLMVLPSQGDSFSTVGLIEVGFMLGTIGTFALVVFWNLSKASVVPLNEPNSLQQSHITA